MKYHFIKEHRSEFTVKKMCQMFKVFVNGYYHRKRRKPSSRAVKNKRLKKRILELYAEHNGMASSLMITADLKDEFEFFDVSNSRVVRLMLEMDLNCKTVNKYVVTTESKHNKPVAPNLLNREFNVKNLTLRG